LGEQRGHDESKPSVHLLGDEGDLELGRRKTPCEQINYALAHDWSVEQIKDGCSGLSERSTEACPYELSYLFHGSFILRRQDTSEQIYCAKQEIGDAIGAHGQVAEVVFHFVLGSGKLYDGSLLTLDSGNIPSNQASYFGLGLSESLEICPCR
jgi:hypothetical protein